MLVPVLYGHNRIITSSLSHRAPSLYLLPTMNAITCCWVCLLAVVLLGPYALVNAAPTQATPNTYLAPVALGESWCHRARESGRGTAMTWFVLGLFLQAPPAFYRAEPTSATRWKR